MPPIPTEFAPESSLAVLREGYTFISRRARRHGSDIFAARLLGQPTYCMTGPEAARVFYDTTRFQREDGPPLMLQNTLTGQGAIQATDGAQHLARKGMFLRVLGPEAVKRLLSTTETDWVRAVAHWTSIPSVRLYDELNELLCRAVCRWAGVHLDDEEVARCTSDMVAMIEAPGSAGARHLKGVLARRRAEAWAEGLIEDVRLGEAIPSQDTALSAVANFRDETGELLPPRIAAVELLNILRPTVAVSRYIVFSALALHSYPRTKSELDSGVVSIEWFAQEVRRFYPFFPLIAARTRDAFEWQGYELEAGRRTLLDLFGTNRDPRSWTDPHLFMPERFRDWNGDPFTLVPQGGGDTATGHRCPGEDVTLALMCQALEIFRQIQYDVPPQDLRVRLSRVPALPESAFVIARVRTA